MLLRFASFTLCLFLSLLWIAPLMAQGESKKPKAEPRKRPRLEPGIKIPTFNVPKPTFSFKPPEPKERAVEPPRFEAPHVEPPLITPPKRPYVFGKMPSNSDEPLPIEDRSYFYPYLFRVGPVDLYGPPVEIGAGGTVPTIYARGVQPMVIFPTVRKVVGE